MAFCCFICVLIEMAFCCFICGLLEMAFCCFICVLLEMAFCCFICVLLRMAFCCFICVLIEMAFCCCICVLLEMAFCCFICVLLEMAFCSSIKCVILPDAYVNHVIYFESVFKRIHDKVSNVTYLYLVYLYSIHVVFSPVNIVNNIFVLVGFFYLIIGTAVL